MTDLEKHVSQPGRDKLVKKVREKIDELGITYIFFPIYICNRKSCWKRYTCRPLGKNM